MKPETLRVYMVPTPSAVAAQVPSGIATTIQKYQEFGRYYHIEFLESEENAQVVATHAGTPVTLSKPLPTVAHCHGLYWTADSQSDPWEYRVNRDVARTIAAADIVTVPSQWVAQTLRRDMHLDPVVLPHGVDHRAWSPHPSEIPYILWNKNRASDACDPTPVQYLSDQFPQNYFLSTFAKNPVNAHPNLKVIGTIPHAEMHNVVEAAHIYLATTKETFGIGTLEAMASGVPILGYNWGGTRDIVQHGVHGYLAEPGNLDDLAAGLNYCLLHHDQLGANARLRAIDFKWNAVLRKLRETYETAIERFSKPHSVSVVIPCFNKRETIGRTVQSVLSQTVLPDKLIVVDNNSSDDSAQVASSLRQSVEAVGIEYIVTNCPTQGVAHARNWGCGLVDSRYISCLDGDDEIAPTFLSECVDSLRGKPSLGLAYTKLAYVKDSATPPQIQSWPGEYNFDGFLVRQNQVPTCCVFRTDLWHRLGGYRQRYAPDGAGTEDAEFWMRIGANGYGGELASYSPLFLYHAGGQTSDPSYHPEDWLYWHPWATDHQHPFASWATPANGLSSHPVRAYDRPVISVIIPCTHDHLHYLIDTIDSLEAQTLRQWEAILVFDFIPEETEIVQLKEIYPYLTIITSGSDRPKGAGYCRNRGVDAALAPLITFLDADDWLEPDCLRALVSVYNSGGEFTYTDYFGHAVISKEAAQQVDAAGRLKLYRAKTSTATILHNALDFECQRAIEEPSSPNASSFYIWNIVTTLVTKEAHYAIGGFDEKMMSYEDWDYFLRLARHAYCFTHIPAPLVNYRLHTGSRREIGRQNHETLIDYLLAKYKGEEAMPCRGCSGGRSRSAPQAANYAPPAQTSRSMVPSNERSTRMSADTTIMVKLIDGNIGEHPITIRDPQTQVSHNYGYRRDGETFLMQAKHAAMYPHKFQVQQEKVEAPQADQRSSTPPPPPPPMLAKLPTDGAPNPAPPTPSSQPPTPPSATTEENWQEWGMTELQSQKLNNASITTKQELVKLSPSGLRDLADMSQNKAEQYLGRAIEELTPPPL